MKRHLFLIVVSISFVAMSWDSLTDWRIALTVAAMLVVSWVLLDVVRRLSATEGVPVRQADTATALSLVWACQIAVVLLAAAYVQMPRETRIPLPSVVDSGGVLGGILVLAWWQQRLWSPDQGGHSDENI